MKKLLVKLFVFALLFVSIDTIIGKSLSAIIAKAKGGDTGKNSEIVDGTTADIILFGSSRCDHHYDPRIIADSLGCSCYNAGRDGNGILLMYPYYEMMSARYHPRLIIYDISSFDLAEDDYAKYLGWLRQFYGRPQADSMAWSIDPNEKYKMISQAYRFNGKGLQIISDAIRPVQHDILGYKPLYGTLNYEPETESGNNKQKPIDSFKERYLVRFIQDCKRNKTKLVFMVSPTYGQTHHFAYYEALSKLCRENEVPFFYNQNDGRFVNNRNFFRDKVHLNNVGAEVYTKLVVSEVKSILHD